MRYLSALILVAALAGCATPPDVPTLQKRAVAAIQTAQQVSTQALIARTITPQQDRDAQARLATARASVLAATTSAQITAATEKAGVQP